VRRKEQEEQERAQRKHEQLKERLKRKILEEAAKMKQNR
jgi:hypothetical protein